MAGWPNDYLISGIEPYFQEEAGIIYCADCRDILPHLPKVDLVLTDPPYNVDYHYESYKDKLTETQYLELIKQSIAPPCCIIHYPEDMFKMSFALKEFPSECVAWIYNAHTPRKWRMIAWYGIKPDYSLIKQPYKNINDSRIIEKIHKGEIGCSIYDWWHIEQVKNVSLQKTEHPCQIPIRLIKNIIKITHCDIILDPFLGSGTTAVAAKELEHRYIGIEIEEKYCAIAVKRLKQCNPLPFNQLPIKPEKRQRKLIDG